METGRLAERNAYPDHGKTDQARCLVPVPLSVREYLDYRRYLKDVLAWKKRRNPKVSYRSFARRLELDAAQLHRVVHGKAHLHPSRLGPLAAALGLDGLEARHLARLVDYGRSTTEAGREALLSEILGQMLQYRAEDRPGGIPRPDRA